MLNLNPTLVCPSCGLTSRLQEASRFALQCPRCGVDLVCSGGSDAVRSPVVSVADKLDGRREEILVAELVLPSQNVRDVPEVVSFISSMPRPVALEVCGSHLQVSLRFRGPKSAIDSLSSSIPMHWPGAYLRGLDSSSENHPSPNGANAYGLWITLKKEAFLPLAFSESFLRGDPMHGLLSAFQGLEEDQGMWLQIFLPAVSGEPAWLAQTRERIKLELQRGYQVQGGGQSEAYAVLTPAASTVSTFSWKSLGRLLFLLGLFGAALFVILSGFSSLANLLWSLPLGILLLGAGLWVVTRNPEKDDWKQTDLKVVSEKINQNPIIPVSIRLVAWASTPAQGGVLLRRALSSLEKYGRADGNAFGVYESTDAFPDPAWPDEITARPACWLGPRELAEVWHIPVVSEQVALPMMPVNASEWRVPLPEEVAGDDPIGESCSPDKRIRVPVCLSKSAQRGGILLVGKARMGKSTLWEHLFQICMRDIRRPAAIVTDPHGDLARRIIGMVPPERLQDVVYWDVLDREYSIGMNPLDMFLPGNTIQDAVALMINVGEALWTDYWGPRMRIPLQRALTALAAANTRRPRDQQLGPSALSFLLNAKKEVRNEFLNAEVRGTPAADEVMQYFMGEFDILQPNLLQQIIQPVTSKAHRFEEEPAKWLFSPPQSTLSLHDIISQRKILILSTHQLSLGDDLAGFIGAFVVNSALRALGAQEMLPFAERVPLYLISDECQSIPAVRWDLLIQQMQKLGGVPGLGTQSLSTMRKFDPRLPSTIFSGVQTVFSFQVNSEDAIELSEGELMRTAGGPGKESLITLKPYHAWVRTINEEKTPLQPFLVKLNDPIEPDPGIIEQVMSLRRNYSVPIDFAKNECSEVLNQWMQSYNLNRVVSDGGGAPLEIKSSIGENTPSPAPQYANRPSALTADLPEGLHDIISAPQPRGRRAVKPMPLKTSVPDSAYMKAVTSASGENG